MQNDTHTSYLRRDLTTLVVLVLLIAAAVGVLWYAEQRDAWFSRLAAQLLDATGH